MQAPQVTKWRASYGGQKPFTVDGVDSLECPVSLAHQHPELIDIVKIVKQAEGIAEQFGSALGSPAEWPGRFYDLVGVVKGQERARDYWRMEASR